MALTFFAALVNRILVVKVFYLFLVKCIKVSIKKNLLVIQYHRTDTCIF